MERLKELYAGDQQKQQLAIMEMYKRETVARRLCTDSPDHPGVLLTG